MISHWKGLETTNLMLEMSKDLRQNVSLLDLTLAGQSALKHGACSFCKNEREKSCQDFRQLHRDLGQRKWPFETIVMTHHFAHHEFDWQELEKYLDHACFGHYSQVWNSWFNSGCLQWKTSRANQVVSLCQIVSTQLCFEWARNNILIVHLAPPRGWKRKAAGLLCLLSGRLHEASSVMSDFNNVRLNLLISGNQT